MSQDFSGVYTDCLQEAELRLCYVNLAFISLRHVSFNGDNTIIHMKFQPLWALGSCFSVSFRGGDCRMSYPSVQGIITGLQESFLVGLLGVLGIEPELVICKVSVPLIVILLQPLLLYLNLHSLFFLMNQISCFQYKQMLPGQVTWGAIWVYVLLIFTGP